MSHYKCLADLSSIDDPLMYREMYGFIALNKKAGNVR